MMKGNKNCFRILDEYYEKNKRNWRKEFLKQTGFPSNLDPSKFDFSNINPFNLFKGMNPSTPNKPNKSTPVDKEKNNSLPSETEKIYKILSLSKRKLSYYHF